MIWMLGMMLAATPPQTAATPEAVKPEPVRKERKICRTNVDTGSRLGRSKTCRTRTEWEAADAADRRDVDQLRRD